MFPKKKASGAQNRKRKIIREEETAKLTKITDCLPRYPSKRAKVDENEFFLDTEKIVETNNTAIKTKVSRVEENKNTLSDSKDIFSKSTTNEKNIHQIRMICQTFVLKKHQK